MLFWMLLWRCFWTRLTFQSVDWGKQIAFLNVGGHTLIQSVDGLTRQKGWLSPSSARIPLACLPSIWDIFFFCLWIWVETSSWASSLPAFELKLYHWLSWASAGQLTLQILGLGSLHITWPIPYDTSLYIYVYPIGSVSLEHPNDSRRLIMKGEQGKPCKLLRGSSVLQENFPRWEQCFITAPSNAVTTSHIWL